MLTAGRGSLDSQPHLRNKETKIQLEERVFPITVAETAESKL